MMDHETIERLGLVDRYFRGDLEGEEEAAFERHFFACESCQADLAVARDFRRGLQHAAAEDLGRLAVHGGVLAWLVRRGRAAQATILTRALLAAAALPTAFFLSRGGGGAAAGTPAVVLLSGLRGADQPAKAFPAGEPVILALDAGTGPYDHYEARVLDSNRQAVYTARELRPNDLEVLMLAFPAGYFATGDYRLELEGVTAAGTAEPLGAYPFRVER